MIRSLQNRHLSLSEIFKIADSTVEQVNRGSGKVADAVRAKMHSAFSEAMNTKNKKQKNKKAVMNSNLTAKVNLEKSLADILKLKYALGTSDFESICSQYKCILRQNIRFTFKYSKGMFVTIVMATDKTLILFEVHVVN